MRIRFRSEQVYENEGPGRGPRFPEGHVLDESEVGKALGLRDAPTPEWSQGFLNRWVQRQVADIVDPKEVQSSDVSKVGSGRAPKALDLNRMTRAQLEAVAKDRKVDVSKAKTRADVLSAIVKAEKAQK